MRLSIIKTTFPCNCKKKKKRNQKGPKENEQKFSEVLYKLLNSYI